MPLNGSLSGIRPTLRIPHLQKRGFTLVTCNVNKNCKEMTSFLKSQVQKTMHHFYKGDNLGRFIHVFALTDESLLQRELHLKDRTCSPERANSFL